MILFMSLMGEGKKAELDKNASFCCPCAALIRREWKSRFDRVMKALGSPGASESVEVSGAEVDLVSRDQSVGPKRKAGGERARACPPGCDHNVPLPSDVLIEVKVPVQVWLRSPLLNFYYFLNISNPKFQQISSFLSCRSC